MEIEYYYLATCIYRDGRRKRKKFPIPMGDDGWLNDDEAYRKAEAWIDNQKDWIESKISSGHRRINNEY